jgi:pimeloyl-ACP methyl ester carboxylesterase
VNPAPFNREPAPSAPTREVIVNAGGVALSGLYAEPAGGTPRALIVAVHGFGMHAGYFDGATVPGLSLLKLASQLGFSALAVDRPGFGASTNLPDEQVSHLAQASLLLHAIDAFTDEHPVGGGVFVVAHSYGLRVVWSMAVDPRASAWLGIDGSGNGIRYAFSLDDQAQAQALFEVEGDRGPSWGPAALYAPETYIRGTLPVHSTAPIQAYGNIPPSEELVTLGPRIRVPVRLTFGEHERFWEVGEEHRAALQAALPHALAGVETEPNAGHNISLGRSGRSYHLKVLAFAEACLLARALG